MMGRLDRLHLKNGIAIYWDKEVKQRTSLKKKLEFQ